MPSFHKNTSGGASVSGGALAPRSRRGNTNQADGYWRGGAVGGLTPTLEYLVLAGGGGSGYASGAPSVGGAGGGAGGYRSSVVGEYSGGLQTAESLFVPVAGTQYTVTVGGGGGGQTNGSNSVFSTITSTGGGAGQYQATSTDGGSGAGYPEWYAWHYTQFGHPTLSPKQGSGGAADGLTGASVFGNSIGGGSGGGAGGTWSATANGDKVGLSSVISGSSVGRGGGGGGSGYDGDNRINAWWQSFEGYSATYNYQYGGGRGGLGGAGYAGEANKGGGGGSGQNTASGGGSGVVILRYPDNYDAAATTTGSPTITVTGGFRIYVFDGSGSITF